MITVFTLGDWMLIGIVALGILFMIYSAADYYIRQFMKWLRR